MHFDPIASFTRSGAFAGRRREAQCISYGSSGWSDQRHSVFEKDPRRTGSRCVNVNWPGWPYSITCSCWKRPCKSSAVFAEEWCCEFKKCAKTAASASCSSTRALFSAQITSGKEGKGERWRRNRGSSFAFGSDFWLCEGSRSAAEIWGAAQCEEQGRQWASSSCCSWRTNFHSHVAFGVEGWSYFPGRNGASMDGGQNEWTRTTVQLTETSLAWALTWESVQLQSIHESLLSDAFWASAAEICLRSVVPQKELFKKAQEQCSQEQKANHKTTVTDQDLHGLTLVIVALVHSSKMVAILQ